MQLQIKYIQDIRKMFLSEELNSMQVKDVLLKVLNYLEDEIRESGWEEANEDLNGIK